MSQMGGMAGDGFAVQPPRAVSSGRAVLLLALAVALGVVLLHELDKTPATTTQAASDREVVAGAAPPGGEAPAPVAPQVRQPSEVKVLVANGTTVNGAASKVAGRLQPIGYQLLEPGNTAAPSPGSVVQHAPGYQPEALALATSLGIPALAVQEIPNPAPIADLKGANVVVIVGNELAGQQSTTPAAGNGTGQTAATAGQQQTGQQQTNANPALSGPLTPNGGANSNTNPQVNQPAP